MKWHIDYFTITLWGDNVVKFFNEFFQDTFSNMIDEGHGGRFYMQTHSSDLGIILRQQPYGDQDNRATISFPGKACQLMGYEVIKRFYIQAKANYDRINVNRIDLAFDHCNFTIDQVENCLLSNDLRSYFKRDTIKIYNNPFELQEDNKTIGTQGISIGGRSSTRFMRIYNKHGFTRLELEFKHSKAEIVAFDVLMADNVEEALKYAIGHVRDYCDFFTEWWEVFCNNLDRLFSKLPGSVKSMTADQIKSWFENQIATAFFVIANLEGGQYLDSLWQLGREKFPKSKYRNIFEIGDK